MKLSKNSWHAKLYNLTYSTVLPKNLCPYFWKVMLALILFFPFAAIFTPLKIFWLIKNKINKDEMPDEISDDGFLSELLAMALVLDAALFCLFSMVYMWFGNVFDKKNTVFEVFGWLGYLIIFVGFIVFVVEKIKERREENWVYSDEPYKEKQPNILKEFVKAKYNKYCPQIEWKNKAQ